VCSLANTYHDIEIASKNRLQQGLRMLLSSEGEGLLRLLDHLPHFTDAFGALGLALVPRKDIPRPGGARLDGRGDITFAKTVAVADVHG
jgi:hypothetical protein